MNKKKRLTKKEREKFARERARREVEAREGSEERVARIEVLEKELRKKRAVEGLRELGGTEFGRTLAELLRLYREENEHLLCFRGKWEVVEAHYARELEDLWRASRWAEIDAEVNKLIKTGAIKFSSRQKSEAKRRMVPGCVGLIELKFGSVFPDHVQPFVAPPTCLDGIFSGGGVTLRGLEELFGIRRQRFPRDLRKLRHDDGRYYHDAFLRIMEVFLSEEATPPGKKGAPRRPWLIDPLERDLRERVLNRIEERILALEVPENIAEEFLGVVRHHLALIREKNQV